jgi:starch phosphorylase
LPAAIRYNYRAAAKGVVGEKIVNTRGELRTKWEGIRFGDSQPQSIDKGLNFRVEVFLNGVGTDQVSVEVYADGLPGGDAEVIKLELDPSTEQLSLRLYHAKIITSRPASDYTIRVIPEYEGVLIPMEDNQILWQH